MEPTVDKTSNPTRQYVEPIIFLVLLLGGAGYMIYVMGISNMFSTLMATSYDLLISTVFFIMSITVLMGALSKLLTEFGVVSLLERVLRPLMKPIFGLPGIAALGAVVTFLSDNPAIIALSKDKKFAGYFKTYQMVSLTNFGTAFGMGLTVIVFMMSQGYLVAPLVGVVGACVGCVISTRLMQRFCLKDHPEYDCSALKMMKFDEKAIDEEETTERKDSVFMRFLNSILDGGKVGVDLGMSIIPGVLIISTIVMMLTNTGAGPDGTDYTGAAYQGVGVLPWICDKIDFLFKWLWGFTDTRLIAFPVTALGAVGAAMGVVPQFNAEGILDANAVAVFTAIGMCWSGYLSTHSAMLDAMGFRKLISKAIVAHTIAGVCAGFVAHWLWEFMVFIWP